MQELRLSSHKPKRQTCQPKPWKTFVRIFAVPLANDQLQSYKPLVYESYNESNNFTYSLCFDF